MALAIFSTTTHASPPVSCLSSISSNLVCIELDDLIDQSVLLGLLGTHEVIAVEVDEDLRALCLLELEVEYESCSVVPFPIIYAHLLTRLPSHHRVHLDEVVTDLHDLSSLHLDVLRLPLRSAHGLVDHDPRVGKGHPLPLGPGRQDEATHRGGQADVDGHHLRLDVLHGVVKGKAGDDRPSGGVYVYVDGLCAVLAVQVQQNPNDLIRDFVVDLSERGVREANCVSVEWSGLGER